MYTNDSVITSGFVKLSECSKSNVLLPKNCPSQVVWRESFGIFGLKLFYPLE